MLTQNLPRAVGRGELPRWLYVLQFNLFLLLFSLWFACLALLASGKSL